MERPRVGLEDAFEVIEATGFFDEAPHFPKWYGINPKLRAQFSLLEGSIIEGGYRISKGSNGRRALPTLGICLSDGEGVELIRPQLQVQRGAYRSFELADLSTLPGGVFEGAYRDDQGKLTVRFQHGVETIEIASARCEFFQKIPVASDTTSRNTFPFAAEIAPLMEFEVTEDDMAEFARISRKPIVNALYYPADDDSNPYNLVQLIFQGAPIALELSNGMVILTTKQRFTKTVYPKDLQRICPGYRLQDIIIHDEGLKIIFHNRGNTLTFFVQWWDFVDLK